MPLQGGLLLAALPNLYLNESPVNYVTDGNALSTYLIGNDSNLLIVFYVQIMPDDFVMQLHRF